VFSILSSAAEAAPAFGGTRWSMLVGLFVAVLLVRSPCGFANRFTRDGPGSGLLQYVIIPVRPGLLLTYQPQKASPSTTSTEASWLANPHAAFSHSHSQPLCARVPADRPPVPGRTESRSVPIESRDLVLAVRPSVCTCIATPPSHKTPLFLLPASHHRPSRCHLDLRLRGLVVVALLLTWRRRKAP
jgi:hypothetical protein